MTRRESRETVFALIFESLFKEDSLEDILENAKFCRDIKLDGYAKKLVAAVFEHQAELDAVIEKYSDRWKLNRISKPALAILRLAACEIKYFENLPVGVSINEAVELAKKYATEEDASFINGLLGAYARAMDKPAPESDNVRLDGVLDSAEEEGEAPTEGRGAP